MRTQLPEIINFVVKNGDLGAVHQMEGAGSVLEAANIWGKQVERYGINDVHSTGIALATNFMNAASPLSQQGPTAKATKVARQAAAHATHFALGGEVLALGGSATAGVGSTKGRTYEDDLSKIIKGHPVRNAGISGNELTQSGGGGVAGEARFKSLVRPNTKVAIVWEGNNDIARGVSSGALETGYKNVIAEAHDAGIRTVGGTLQPVGWAASSKDEKTRRTVNSWIRRQTAAGFDQVADFDHVLRDPKNISRIAPKYSSNAGPAHPGDAGYSAVAATAAGAVNRAFSEVAHDAAVKKLATVKATSREADQARITKLGTQHSHPWLVATAERIKAKMLKYSGKGDLKDYEGAAGYYRDLEAAITRWPTQLNAIHDVAAADYHTDLARAAAAKKKGDKKGYASWSKKAAAAGAKIKKTDTAMLWPHLNSVQQLSYWMANDTPGLWNGVAYQLRNHSLDPAPVGKLTHADMSRLALNVTPSVLDALYSGPGKNGSNWPALAAGLKGDLSDGAGIYSQGSGPELALLGKLTGIHGSMAGKRFALGGLLPAGAGFGIAGGVPFTFNEGGNREKIVPGHVQTPGESGMTASQAERLIDAVNRNTTATVAGDRQTNKNLSGMGHGMF